MSLALVAATRISAGSFVDLKEGTLVTSQSARCRISRNSFNHDRLARRIGPLVLVVTSLALTVPARADGLYVGAGAYLTDIEVLTESSDDVTPALFLGYQFLDSNFLMLSAEVGYYDLGSVHGAVGGLDFSLDAEAYSLAGVAYLPIGPFFEVYGKTGIAQMNFDTSFGGELLADDGTEVFVGVGAAFDFLDTIDVYAEYLYFDNTIDSQMFGIGIRLDLF